jgi:hypothetical protein
MPSRFARRGRQREESITRALSGSSSRRPQPVNALADPHHLADSDPAWAGGDALRGLDMLITLTPKVRFA